MSLSTQEETLDKENFQELEKASCPRKAPNPIEHISVVSVPAVESCGGGGDVRCVKVLYCLKDNVRR